MKKIKLLLVLPFLFIINQASAQQFFAGYGDIVMFYNPGTEYVDNLYCNSQMMGQFQITVSNSIMNDTVKIIYNGNSQQDTVINTTGSIYFSVGPAWSNYGMLNIPFMSNGFDYYISTNINKIIAHNDTLNLDFVSLNLPATNPGCTYDEISGRFYIDNNFDCIYNSGDDGVIGNIQVQTNYLSGVRTDYEYTNSNGQFQDTQFKSDGLINATLKIPSIYNFAYTIPACAQIMYTVTSLPATGLDFVRECAADIDLRTYVHGVWPGARPLIPFDLHPRVSNVGCQPTSGILELVLDPNVTYDAVNSSNPADYTVGNSLFWNYTNLTNVGTSSSGYWNQFIGGVSLTPNASVNIGDILTFTVVTPAPANDANPSNNSYSISIPVVNSYDPNVKNVVPRGEGTEGFIPATTQKLTYTIDFQNTGNADAINIYILDTLETNVIPTSLKIISTSHTMNPQWLSNNVLRFDFPQIHLADSTSDEAASHGFVTFEIDMAQGLAPGVTIENTAYIYFDANPAIITNTAKNTIEFPTSSVNELNSSVAGLEVIVYPNPMTESTTFIMKNDQVRDFSLELYDMTGKLVVQKQSNNSQQVTINRNSLQNGVYIYKIVDYSTNKASNGKLIIQ